MKERVQAEMGFASHAMPMSDPRRRISLSGLVVAFACLTAFSGDVLASDAPPQKPLPEFSYDVRLAPEVPVPSGSPSRPNTAPPGAPAAMRPKRVENRSRHADLVRVYKAERRLVLFAKDRPIDEFRIALGSRPIGPKRQRGDGRTPEGRYTIDWRKADSDFYRALHISYPNPNDRRHAQERGVSPGGSIMIHGLPNGLGMIGAHHALNDWTDGCIAVTNEEMALLWESIPDGVPIEIFP